MSSFIKIYYISNKAAKLWPISPSILLVEHLCEEGRGMSHGNIYIYRVMTISSQMNFTGLNS